MASETVSGAGIFIHMEAVDTVFRVNINMVIKMIIAFNDLHLLCIVRGNFYIKKLDGQAN